MSTQIPISALVLIRDGWQLQIYQTSTGKYYAEMDKWGWAKNGSRRRRISMHGYGDTLTEAIDVSAEKALKEAEKQAA